MRALLAFSLVPLGSLAAWADPRPTADAPETPTLEHFAATHRTCLEWSDGCAICTRRDDAPPACSLPGIACQPAAVTCAIGATPTPKAPPK